MSKTPTTEKAQADKAIVVSSVSLSEKDWNYLKSLAAELAAAEAKSADPAIAGKRATVSQAVRHLIAKDAERRKKDAEGRLLFGAGVNQQRRFDMSTGSTAVTSAVGAFYGIDINTGRRRK